MNKGFTLVELLAVVVILGVLGLITIPTVGTILDNSKERAKTAQIEEIKKAAKSWSAENLDLISEDRPTYVSVNELLESGYIDAEEVKDPTKKNENLNGCVEIKYSNDVSNYVYEYTDCLN